MKIINLLIIIIILFNFNLSKAEDKSLNSKITKNLRCLVCQGQSVHDSDSEFAISLKLVVEKKIDEGMSEKEIYEFLQIKYGDWILYDPELNQKTFILWFLPLLLFSLVLFPILNGGEPKKELPVEHPLNPETMITNYLTLITTTFWLPTRVLLA